tara:strand:+ start:131 stop:736 length:606 start_codon:yes stop_codon:yes gene_type:complete
MEDLDIGEKKSFRERLDGYLKENGGRTGASKKSYGDIQKAIKKNGAERSNGVLDKGRMYTFRYFNAQRMPFDTWPVVIGLGMSDDGHQLGINLHYIPYLTRVPFVETFINSYKGSIHEQTIGGKANDVRKQRELDYVQYKQVKQSFGMMYNITYAIRQYDLKNIRNPIVLSYENWHLGTVNDENNFNGTNINEAQANYFGK